MSERVRFLCLFVGAALVALVVAYGAHRAIVQSWQQAHLGELAAQTVNRTDVAIDHAVIALSGLIEDGLTTCGPEAARAGRGIAFDAGAIRDIQISRGEVECRAFDDAGGVSVGEALAGDWRPARNGRIELAGLAGEDADHLAVRWVLDPAHSLIAIMNAEFLIFDVLPMSLRGGASISLSVGEGGRIVSQARGMLDPEAGRVFSAASSRYPTRVDIRVAEAALGAWTGDIGWLGAALAGVLSLVFGYAVARALSTRRSFADDFKAAIACGEVTPYYQPIVSLAEKRPVGVEMLARWRRPDGSFIAPAQFIPMVEMNDCADLLVAHLICRADAELGRHFARDRTLKLAVNIAPAQFERPGFAAWLVRLIGETRFAPSQITVEVTERQPLASIEGSRQVSIALQKAGFEIALDDAGTGHNGLAVMKSLCAGCVKIDKLFIDEIDNDRRTRALVEMMVGAANGLGMGIVAEGIERNEQAAVLATMGVGHGQGYLFARPMPADELAAYMAGMRRKAKRRPERRRTVAA